MARLLRCAIGRQHSERALPSGRTNVALGPWEARPPCLALRGMKSRSRPPPKVRNCANSGAILPLKRTECILERMTEANLGKLLEARGAELRQLVQHLAAGDRRKFVTSAATFVTALATGNPAIAVLAPFADEAVARAFASAADKRFQEELARFEVEDERQAFVALISDAMEAAIGQAVLQLVRVEHRVKDELIEALGGMRDELATFREDFQSRLDTEAVRIDTQRVLAGAVGIRVSRGARERVFVQEQTVSGAGSIGIVLGS